MYLVRGLLFFGFTSVLLACRGVCTCHFMAMVDAAGVHPRDRVTNQHRCQSAPSLGSHFVPKIEISLSDPLISRFYFYFFFPPVDKLVSSCMLEYIVNCILETQTLQAAWDGPFPAQMCNGNGVEGVNLKVFHLGSSLVLSSSFRRGWSTLLYSEILILVTFRHRKCVQVQGVISWQLVSVGYWKVFCHKYRKKNLEKMMLI